MAVAPQFIMDPQASLGLLSLGYAALGAGPYPPVIVRKVLHQVIFADQTLPDALTSQIQLSFAEAHGTAEVVARRKPSVGAEDDPIEIWAGTIDRLGRGVFCRRFKGTVVRFDGSSDDGHSKLICRDQLWPLEKYVQPSVKGLSFADITASSTATASDLVMGVLTIVGVSFNAANFGDTGRVLGTIAPEQYRWKHPETARSYVDRVLSQATPGWRCFQSGDGELYLAQIKGRPRNAADFALIEGFNVVGATGGQRGTEQLLTGAHVTGYDTGRGNGAVTYDIAPATASSPVAELSSSLIETVAHAQEMAEYLVEESDRELVKTLSCTTPSDDVLGPAQTHVLLLPRNNITEPGFCQTLTITVSNTDFRQTPGHLAGGLPLDYQAPPF